MSETGMYKYTTQVQLKILALLWRDEQSYNTYRETIKPKYFSKSIHIDLCRIIFDYHDKYKTSPTLDALVEEVTQMCERTKSKQKLEEDYLETVAQMAEIEFPDIEYIKDKILSFGKRQALVDAVLESAEILEKKPDTQYNQIEKLVKEAMLVGEDINDLGVDIYEGIEERFLGYQNDEDVIERIPTGMEVLDSCLKGGLGRTEMGVIVAPPGRGKALHPDTPILTPTGYKPIKQINIGDYVISVDGTKTKVTNKFYHEKKHMYKVRMLDGSEVICCDEHLWTVQDRNDRNKRRTRWKTLELKEMIPNIRVEHDTHCNYSIPVMTKPCELESIGKIKINPWLLGAFIGDGCSSSKNFTFNNQELDVIQKFDRLLPESVKLSNINPDVVEHNIVISDSYVKGFQGKNPFRESLEEIGLFGKLSYEKFIPESYLFTSPENRLQLLQGLIDTDGWVKSRTSIEFSTASEVLANQVKFLCESLGIFAKISSKMGKYSKKDKEGNIIRISTRKQFIVLIKPLNGIIPATSKKHLDKLKINPMERRFIKSVECVGESEAICITVDHPSALYVIKDGIVTHNTTTLISIGGTAVEEGYNVLHISLENNEKQIVRNYDLRLLKKDMEYVKNNTHKTIAAMFNIKKYRKGNLRVKKYSPKSVTVATIRALLDQLKAVKGFVPDVLIVDYGAILKPSVNFSEKRTSIEGIYEDLRAIADDYNLALWTAAQGNRGALSKKVVTMADLAECFAIGNTSDVMLCLCQTSKEKTKGDMRLFLAKIRDSADSLVLKGKILYDVKRLEMHEVVQQEDEDEEDEENWE